MTAMTKNTAKIVEELALCDDFKTFYDENRDYMVTATLVEMLRDRRSFAAKQWRNVCAAGPFSADRAIRQYAKEIWKIR